MELQPKSTMARFDAKTCKAVSSSILALSLQIILKNADNYVICHQQANQDVNTMMTSYKNTVSQREGLCHGLRFE